MTQSLSTQPNGAPVDRQREREARTQRPVRPGDRLPAPPRQRRPVMAALAVVLILGGAAVAGLLALRVDDRQAVLVARQDIPVGKEITQADLAVARMAADDVASIPAAQAGQVIGKFAAQGVHRSQLLDSSMVTDQGFLKSGTVAVGVPMQSGRVPVSGFRPGDTVRIISVSSQSGQGGKVLVENAVISSTTSTATSGGAFGASSGSSTDPAATVIVSADAAPAVAQAAAQDSISLVLVSRGATTSAGN